VRAAAFNQNFMFCVNNPARTKGRRTAAPTGLSGEKRNLLA
jgi:hypothetical protein